METLLTIQYTVFITSYFHLSFVSYANFEHAADSRNTCAAIVNCTYIRTGAFPTMISQAKMAPIRVHGQQRHRNPSLTVKSITLSPSNHHGKFFQWFLLTLGRNVIYRHCSRHFHIIPVPNQRCVTVVPMSTTSLLKLFRNLLWNEARYSIDENPRSNAQ